MHRLRWFMSLGLSFITITGCVFIVRSLDNRDHGLLDKQIAKAKQNIMENTKWKLDTYVIYQTFDGNSDDKLNQNELTAMLLVAAMEKSEADATAGTLTIVGDTDEDNKLTADEFKQLFGINS